MTSARVPSGVIAMPSSPSAPAIVSVTVVVAAENGPVAMLTVLARFVIISVLPSGEIAIASKLPGNVKAIDVYGGSSALTPPECAMNARDAPLNAMACVWYDATEPGSAMLVAVGAEKRRLEHVRAPPVAAIANCRLGATAIVDWPL